MPQVYSAKVQYWNEATDEPYEDDTYFILPYELVEKTIDDNVCSLDEWTDLSMQPAMDAKRTEWSERVGVPCENLIAFGLWGDFAPYLTRDSILGMLFTALGALRFMRIWFVSISKRTACKCGCKGWHTFQGIWRVLVWSFRVHLSGRWPTVRSDNVPFAESTCIGDKERAARSGGLLQTKGCVLRMTGDWEWMKHGLGLQGGRRHERLGQM